MLGLLILNACSPDVSKSGELHYLLPEGWSVAEDRQVTEVHRKISIITPSGNFAELEVLSGNAVQALDIRDYMRRYIESTFTADELRENTEFEFGDVARAGQQGYFFNVIAPAKETVRFVLEFYQFATAGLNVFVVLTTDPGLPPGNQKVFDQFLSSVQIVE